MFDLFKRKAGNESQPAPPELQVSGEVRDASDARAKLRVMLAPRGLRQRLTLSEAPSDGPAGDGPEDFDPGIA